MKFLDEAKVYLKSGDGGSGCLGFRRERHIALGGPDGGDGGAGGDVVALCVDGLNTLVDFRFRQHFRARNGRQGSGGNRTGAKGSDALLKVPAGTQIFEAEGDILIADLTEPGQRALLAKGGRAGFGNTHYKSSTNRAPRRADPGTPGEERTVVLRLKLIADGGLLGLPNAGKSTFLSKVSRARPKVADYPFTTLIPQLGVVAVGDEEFVLADIPGLIEGAHEGTGLGDKFLRHLERCGVLLHLVDGTESDVAKAYSSLRRELDAYGEALKLKPEVVCLNKCDVLTEEEIESKREALGRAAGTDIWAISGLEGLGVPEVLGLLLRIITEQRGVGAPPARESAGKA